MKKLFLSVCAFALIASCAKKELTPDVQTNPQNAKGISFVYQPEQGGTKAEIIPGTWKMFWYGEVDKIGVFSKNAVVEYSDGRAISTIWDSDRTDVLANANTPESTNKAVVNTYKATRSMSEGFFTGSNDAEIIDFGNPLTDDAPSIRIVWPGTINQAKWVDVVVDEPEKLVIALPATDVQVQDDAAAASTVAYNIMLAKYPSKLDPFHAVNNPNGIKFPDRHQTVGQSIPMELERQSAVVYTKIKNYTQENKGLFGALNTVKFEPRTKTGAPIEGFVYEAGAYSMDILNKYKAGVKDEENGDYQKTLLDPLKLKNLATLNVTYPYNPDNAETGENLYMTLSPGSIPAEGVIKVTYEFDNVTFSFDNTVAVAPGETEFRFEKNTFYPLGANDGVFDLNSQPYVVFDAGIDKVLLINDCFYDTYASLNNIFNAALTTIKDNQGNNIAVSLFKKVIIRTTSELTNNEVAALNKLVAVTDVKIYANTVNRIPNFIGFTPSLVTTLDLPNVTALSATALADLNKMAAMTTLKLPKLTTVPAEAFIRLVALNNVDLRSAQTIGTKAFGVTPGIQVIAPENTIAKPNKFNVTPNVIVSEALTTLEPSAFVNLAGLATIDMPGVNSIGSRAFFFASPNNFFENVNLPSVTIAGIAEDAFGSSQVPYTPSAPRIANLYMPLYDFSNPIIRTHLVRKDFLKKADMSSVGLYYGKDDVNSGMKLEEFPKLTEIKIGAGAILFDNAFRNCSMLAKINIKDASRIGNNAFQNCVKLTNVEINAAEVGNLAFYGASGITDLKFGNAVTTIGDAAFLDTGVPAGFNVELSNVANIGMAAFANSKVIEINLTNVQTLGVGAFQNCNLMIGKYEARRGKNVLYVGASVIPDMAFEGCNKVDIIDFENMNTVINSKSVLIDKSAETVKDLVINFIHDVQINDVDFITVIANGANGWQDDVSKTLHTVNFGGTLNGADNKITVGDNGKFKFTPEGVGAVEQTYTVKKVNKLP